MSSRRRADPSAIDEALIRELIGGHTPALLPREGPLPAPPPQSKNTIEQPEKETADVPLPTTDYTQLFLRSKQIQRRVSCRIEWETQQKLKIICQQLGRGLTLSALIDNILTHHLTMYRDEINEMIKNANKTI